MLPASNAAHPSRIAIITAIGTLSAPPPYCRTSACPRLLPETTVIRQLASCRIRQAAVEKTSAHSSARPWLAPAEDAVVTVPGPMKAAAITDQKRMLRRRVRSTPKVCRKNQEPRS
jgi:hypothetical protein